MTKLERGSEQGANPMRLIRVVSALTLIATYCLIVLGSTVRVTNSGMGCKDWPLCSGQVGPLSTFHPLMEQSHRYLASLVTVLIITLALATWRAGKVAHHVFIPALLSIGVILVQIVLGAVTVFTNNAPFTVALHLLVATFFLSVVTLSTVATFVSPERSWSLTQGPGRLAWSAVVALYLVFVSGSIVVNGGAQSACPSWPACFSSRAATGLVILQLAHRSMVLIGSVLVVTFVVRLVRRGTNDATERNLAYATLVLLGLQVVAGALTALEGGRAAIADVHLALGSALWCCVVAVFALCARGPWRTRGPESSPNAQLSNH
ncbi:MAG: heme A synthase [Acidimicrobiaceae bacterium]|nr:heme A synthase [Acidimicrobiaceae bacterium]